ncbi:MAG: ABC transporter substrate-binding protein [Prevotella sp.]|nr:ABC transporter substrate-binding protein [Prevotella sp.]
MKHLIIVIVGLLLVAACGQSYEETKRIANENRREAMRRDSAALKVAVLPTLDCLPLYVADYYQLFDTIRGGVRLKHFTAQMDCDTAIERGRVEGTVTDLVRAIRMQQRGTKLRYVTVTNAYWQLITNRNARIHQLKQLDDKMVAMTRFSFTDMMTDKVRDSVKLEEERVFKVQINDVNVRMLMLQNNEMDALWMTEPQASMARMMKHQVVFDSRKTKIQPGVVVFREKEMRHPERAKQLQLFVNAYNQACDSINKNGFKHYRDLIMRHCNVRKEVVDSLPDVKKNPYVYMQGPRQEDVAQIEKWLGVKKTPKKDKDGSN